MRSIFCLTAVLAASTLLPAQGTQIPIPAFTNTYSFATHTRGFYFQAPIPFVVSGLRVPDETMNGTQNVEIVLLSGDPAAGTATITSSLFYAAGLPSQTIIPCNVSVNPGDWIGFLGACGTTTMENSYGPSGFASNVLGAPITLSRLMLQSNLNTASGLGQTVFTNTASIGRVEVYVGGNSGFQFPPELVMVSEMVPGTGTLGTQGGPFRGGEFLRFNFTDPQSNNAGLLIWNTINFGVGGSPPAGVTAQIPGLVQVWPGSTPMGVADLIGPSVIGAPDTVLPIPVGLFSNGDTVRFQGITLDPRVQTATRLPVNPTLNTIEFRFTDCLGGSGFEGVAGVGNYPAGWSNGAGTLEWQGNSGGTSSTATGPTSAIEGNSYFYCETSGAVVGSVFSCNTETMTNGGATSLDFQLSRIGVEIGQLEVFLNDGVNPPVLLNTYTGPDPAQTQGGVEWSTESLVLPQPLPTSYSFEFRYTCLPLAGGGSTFNGDLAIDDVCLR